MESLKISLAILSFCGIWKPLSLQNQSSKLFFEAWRFVFAPLPYLIASGQLARIILVDLDFDEINEILFILLSIINICCKSMSFFVRRRDMIKLTAMLSCQCATAKDEKEHEIRRSCQQFIRLITLSSVILVEITALAFLTSPFFQSKANRELPFKIWLPYNISSEKVFWLSYAFQFVAIIVGSLVSVSSNCLIFSFLIEACCQFDLLTYRFMTMPEYIRDMRGEQFDHEIVNKYEKSLLIRNIRHHVYIFKFVDAIKKTFNSCIIDQYIVSSLVISMSVYQLSMSKSIDLAFFTSLLYLMCMLVEFFLYCWFGNELTLKSENFGRSIFNINWITLNQESNKNIVIVMLRSSKPVIISSGFLIVLSLDSFMKTLKLSYSAFSLLRNGAKD